MNKRYYTIPEILQLLKEQGITVTHQGIKYYVDTKLFADDIVKYPRLIQIRNEAAEKIIQHYIKKKSK